MDDSPPVPSAAAGSRSVWRYAMATRAHVVIDAADYFALARDAMLRARERIFLIGWDFDLRIAIPGGRRWWQRRKVEPHPTRLGAFIPWLTRRTPGLRIKVLVWNFGAFKSVLRGTMVFDLLRWRFDRAIAARLDGAHPVGCSHHQKIVVIDDGFAVCGGIDMTGARWDTREHRDGDPRRKRPSGRAYGPWHDVTMLLEGEIAGALGELGQERWLSAGGELLPPPVPAPAPGPGPTSAWPDQLAAEFENVEVGIARTRAAWRDLPEIREIEALFVEQIARARRFVYAETQYFASRRIAEAIALRLDSPDAPEFIIINPLSAEGWLQQKAMDSARNRLLNAVRRHDRHGRFHVFVPRTRAGEPIYVHAKLTIVDDEVLRVGSANMNNRSMGLDSECDVFIDAARPANRHIVPAITRLRHSLLAEHCGLSADQIAKRLGRDGSMAAMIAALPRSPETGLRALERFVPRALSDAEKALADSELLDPERPGEMFEPMVRRGLFRRGGLLGRPG